MNTAHTFSAMSIDEAHNFYKTGGGSYYFEQATSWAGSSLVKALRGGKKADPNVGPAIRVAAELERRLETLAALRDMPSAPEPDTPRPVPANDDLPGLLSSASSDARYVKNLTRDGAAMSMRNVPEALRVVRGLRPKLKAAWALYEAMSEPERPCVTTEQQAEFWHRLQGSGSEAEALRP